MTTWTGEQAAVFDWLANPTDRRALLVRARAGTGKTTTIVHGLGHAAEESAQLCAFNARIAKELAARVPRGTSASTLHSLGLAAIRRAWPDVKVDAKRGWALAEYVAGRRAPKAMLAMIVRLADAGKLRLLNNARDLADLAWTVDAEPSADWRKDGWDVQRVARCAADAMTEACRRTGTVDFADMLYLPWARARDMAPTPSPLVLVDEAQDMNAAQLALARASVATGGRIVVVGDDRQSIYGFMGAEQDGIDRMKRELGALEVPLTTTFRCPQRVVAAARTIVPDYRAHAGNPKGTVARAPQATVVAQARGNDFILSRTNAGAISMCLALLRASVPATVIGRDVAGRLKGLVRKLGPYTIGDLRRRVGEWLAAERQAAIEADVPDRGDEAADVAEAIWAIADGLAGIDEFFARIDALFSDAGGQRVACSTIHKAKGLEAGTIWILGDTFRNAGGQEDNLRYVAITRAKQACYITGDAPLFTAAIEAAAEV